MPWVKVAPLAAIPIGEARAVRIGPDDLLVCRQSEQVVHVLDNVCSHDDGALGSQTLDGPAVTCPRHGARFDIATGAVLRSPAVVGIAIYPARIAGEWVEAELED